MDRSRVADVILAAGLFVTFPLISLRAADLSKDFAIVPTEIQKDGKDFGGDAIDDATISAANEFSWRSFIALNWPATDWPAKPARGIADTMKDFSDSAGPRVWETWKASYELIPKQPATGAAIQPRLWNRVDDPTPAGQTTATLPKVFGSYTKYGDISQALMTIPDPGTEGPLGSPLVCQNHTYTHFEVRMNRASFTTIRGEDFYLRDVIDAHMKASGDGAVNQVKFEFPHGSISVKAAWRELLPSEDSSTYYVRTAPVVDYSTNTFSARKLGLVGLHIVQKTPLREQWVWSSFEHAANVPGLDSGTTTYSYNDGAGATTTSSDRGPIGPMNPYVSPTPSTSLTATGVVREIRLLDQTILDNKKFHDLLPTTSIWRNYHLVLTQWPTKPDAPELGDDLEGKPFPQEPFIGMGSNTSNTTMETFFQNSASCIACHEQAEKAGFDYVFFPLMHADKEPGTATPSSSPSLQFVEHLRLNLKESATKSRELSIQRNRQ